MEQLAKNYSSFKRAETIRNYKRFLKRNYERFLKRNLRSRDGALAD